MFDQKDVVLLPFPYSDLTGAKLRPALIISNKTINSTSDRICCLITSNQSKDNSILITSQSFSNGKLPFKSWVKPHRIFTVHEKIIKKKLCQLTEEFHNDVIKSINHLLK